jgi:hypothetical protein
MHDALFFFISFCLNEASVCYVKFQTVIEGAGLYHISIKQSGCCIFFLILQFAIFKKIRLKEESAEIVYIVLNQNEYIKKCISWKPRPVH